MDGKLSEVDASFKIKDEVQPAVLTMTVVDTVRHKVATQNLTVTKAAAMLKLTPASPAFAVGSEAIIDIEVVDVDGVRAATGLAADYDGASGAIINAPAGAVYSVNSIEVQNFNQGVATARITSNMEGDVVLQVIIREDSEPNLNTGVPNLQYDEVKVKAHEVALAAYQAEHAAWIIEGSPDGAWIYVVDETDPLNPIVKSINGEPKAPELDAIFANMWLVPQDMVGGRTFTGACTVTFGAVTDGGRQLIFFIGAPSFVAGNTPYAAQSPAFIENSRTYLGVRDIGNAIGGAIDWDPDTDTATVTKDGVVVRVTVGAAFMSVTKSGATSDVPLDPPAINRNDRVYLPFRAMLTEFGYTVDWDEATQSIICTI